MKTSLLAPLPYLLQDAAISAYNWRQSRQRRGGQYQSWVDYFRHFERQPAEVLEAEARRRLSDFLCHATSRSEWYASCDPRSLSSFPLLEKQDLVRNLDRIRTIPEAEGTASYTGGTTGASMKVIYTKSDMQQRFALLDSFRGGYGYRVGARTAWFSGKDLASERDVERGRCYRDDLVGNVRFFATFHISARTFDSYWQALLDFKPEFIVGFPSSVLEICLEAQRRGLAFPAPVTAFFPTAETILPIHRSVVPEVLGCVVVDQYASSEGAPFILECREGRLHSHPLSGVFEVLDDNLAPAREGEMVVTSFTTHGTPLIRYRVGDRMRLAEPGARCGCGWNFPIVDWIDGRTSDFVFSPERGRINLGNLSNCTKDVTGIVKFQVQQDELDAIAVRVVADDRFDGLQRARFEEALRLRTGDAMRISIEQVDEIPREKSGKFRFVKNNITSKLP